MKSLRKAFAMITAIFVIVIMATIGVFVMSLSGKAVKSTTMQYQHDQAELYAKSYTEYAILAVTGDDRSSSCLNDIHITLGNYQIRTHISYIANGNEVDVSKCNSVLSSSVKRKDTPLTIIVDSYVDYLDLDSNQYRTVYRRTVQKI